MQTTARFTKWILILVTSVYLGACNNGSSPQTKPQAQPQPQPQPQQVPEPRDTKDKGPAPAVPADSDKKESVAVEDLMPSVAPLDTYGGELLTAYLSDSKSAEDTLVMLFKDYDHVRPTLAEMSMSIQQLKSENRYGSAEQQKVHSLESALQQFLNDERARKDNVSRNIDYGTALAVGIIGGVFADRILSGISKKLPNMVPTKVKESISKRTASKGTASNVAVRLADEVLTGEEIVRRSLTEAIGTKALVEGGYKSELLAAQALSAAKRNRYKHTPFKNFDIAYKEGADHFYARTMVQGEAQYFKVTGEQAMLAAKDGKFVPIPPASTTNFLVQKIRDFGKSTVSFVTGSKQKIVTAVDNPRAARWARGTAVGAATGGLTLLVLRGIDANWVSLPDYVQSLSDQGVDVENFLQTELRQSQADANTLK